MLWLVIKKEIVHNVLSFRFVVIYALLFCLILLAMLLMTSDYRDRFQEHTAAINKERSRLDELKKIDDPTSRNQMTVLRKAPIRTSASPTGMVHVEKSGSPTMPSNGVMMSSDPSGWNPVSA